MSQDDRHPHIQLSLVPLAHAVAEDSQGTRFCEISKASLTRCVSVCPSKVELSKEKESKRIFGWRWSGNKQGGGGRDDDDKHSQNHGPVASEEVRDRLIKSVTRYLRVPDKYLHLVSVLLKSQAYHLVHSNVFSREEGWPVVELPRTEHGKPYIPMRDDEDYELRQDPFPVSVSHQFPFAGMARRVRSAETNPIPMQLGMDIVVFDEPNTKLYSSVLDFVNVFNDNFTRSEWKRIHSHNEERLMLKEFYLQWAVKEAYTKALGVGLGVDFSSFETRFNQENGDEVDETGLVNCLSDPSRDLFHFRGNVVHLNLKETIVEPASSLWDFYFVMLKGDELGGETKPGCACICAGRSDEADCIPPQVEIEWTTLNELIEFHQQPGATIT